jgi:hypothetical protein
MAVRKAARGIAGLSFILGAALSAPSAADEIVLAAPVLQGGPPVRGVYRLERPGTGKGENDAGASFFVAPPALPWSDFQIIMWQTHTASQDARLKALGISAGMVHADRDSPRSIVTSEAEPLLRNDLRWYVENIATDFYSAYHRWFPGRPVNWRFTDVQALYKNNPLDPRAVMRDPSLTDPQWRERIRKRLIETVTAHRAYRPLYYNLADEAGIADLAAYWDFDFSKSSLHEMRQWLKGQYGDLAALNREWATHFTSWDHVIPATTRQAMLRKDGNFSSWADFKAWMDVAFARALALGTDAVHAADPNALAGIEGGQVPGWGGYDYSRLARSVDVMELYDAGENVDIVRSLNPGMVILTTSFTGGAAEEWRVWHELLRGTRGLILWDEKSEFIREDGSLGERGREAASYFREIRGGLGALLINSVAQTDPIAVLYSPASMRTQWMLDWQPRGDGWIARGSEAEGGDDNTVRSATSAFVRGVRQLGLEPRFISSDLIARGALKDGGYRILILPHIVALSSSEAIAIRHFVTAGGVVIADSEPGLFDEHGRSLAEPRLADLFGSRPASGKDAAIYVVPSVGAGTPDGLGQDGMRQLGEIVRRVGVEPPFLVRRPDGAPARDIETHVFRDGTIEIIGLQRNQPAYDVVRTPQENTVLVTLPRGAFVYDLRAGTALGQVNPVELPLDPAAPAILAISDKALPRPTISGPSRLQAGNIAEFRLGLAGPTGAAIDIFRFEVLNPAGEVVPRYSGNIVASLGVATARVPLAFNDPIGVWTIRIIDKLSGQTAIAKLEVSPR